MKFKEIRMNELQKQVRAEKLLTSLCSLLDVIFEITPEGTEDGLGDEAFLTLLEKAQEDASKLKDLIMNG